MLIRTLLSNAIALGSGLLGLLLSGEAVCSTAPQRQFEALERDYVAYVLGQFPEVATQLGDVPRLPPLPRVDERWRDYSAPAIARERETLSGYQARFGAVRSDDLTGSQLIDRRVALSQIAAILREEATSRFIERAVGIYAQEPVRAIQAQLQRMVPLAGGKSGTTQEWARLLTRLQAIPSYLATLQARIDAAVAANQTPDWRLMIDGLEHARAARRFFLDTLPRWTAPQPRDADQNALRKVLDASAEDAAAYQRLEAFLSAAFFSDPAGQTAAALKPAYRSEHYAIGANEFTWAVRNNLADTRSIDELLTATKSSLARQRGAFVTAMHEWVPASKDAPPSVAVEAYRQTLARLMGYAHDARLFDIPPAIAIDVQAAPAFRVTSRSAGQGTFLDNLPGETLYVTAGSVSPSTPGHTLLTVRAGFPGQAWHLKLLRQYRVLVSPVRWLAVGGLDDSLAIGAGGTEGWNAYAEELLGEPHPDGTHGAYTNAEYLEARRNALMLAAAAYIDVALHSGFLGFDDAVTLLSGAVDFLPGSCQGAEPEGQKRSSCLAARAAVQEIARTPTRALAAEVGASQVLQLRERVSCMLGGGFSLQVFHLAFLTQGPVAPGFISDELLQPFYYY
jgi:uncharacterized protein (DUF885 family)